MLVHDIRTHDGTQIAPVALSELRDLLDFLPALYPAGDEWLIRRFDEILCGEAFLATRSVDGVLVGAAIGIQKPANRFKICTIYVSPNFRGIGIGKSLLDEMLEHADSRIPYVTGASTLRPNLLPLFRSRSLRYAVTVANRYGAGRDEDVFIGSARDR